MCYCLTNLYVYKINERALIISDKNYINYMEI